jgi:hypothetical protein
LAVAGSFDQSAEITISVASSTLSEKLANISMECFYGKAELDPSEYFVFHQKPDGR